MTSEEVIPDHEYWISFMVQYQKEKEYVEKYSPAIQFIFSIEAKKRYFFCKVQALALRAPKFFQILNKPIKYL